MSSPLSAAQSLSAFGLLLCQSQPSPLQQGRALSLLPGFPHSQAPRDPLPQAAFPLQTEVKGSDPDLLLPVPSPSQQSHCWGVFLAPPAHTTPLCWDHVGGFFEGFRGLVGSSVLTPHSSRGCMS